MKKELFDELVDALTGAEAWEKGKKLDLRMVELPPPPKPLTPGEIVRIRHGLKVSQAVFAYLLNVSPSTVRAWEQGRREPNQASLKLLQIAKAHPDALVARSG
jgi:putative transcriptional regulator